MVSAIIVYKDGSREYMEFSSFAQYARFIDSRTELMEESMAKHVKPSEIRQGRMKRG